MANTRKGGNRSSAGVRDPAGTATEKNTSADTPLLPRDEMDRDSWTAASQLPDRALSRSLQRFYKIARTIGPQRGRSHGNLLPAARYPMILQRSSLSTARTGARFSRPVFIISVNTSISPPKASVETDFAVTLLSTGTISALLCRIFSCVDPLRQDVRFCLSE